MNEEEKEKTKSKDFHVDNLLKKIKNFLSSDKPADVLIIKAHLLCEYYMNHILILKEVCSAKDIESQSFFQKVEKIKGILNFQDEIQVKTFQKISLLNKLRNKVGHELTYSLSESDVDALGYLEGRQYILDKYDVETDLERLRGILISTVVGIALVLMTMIRSTKRTIIDSNKSTASTQNES